MTALAFTNADLLRALADPALSFDGPKALADHLGRDKSNTLRTVKGLQADGILNGYTLTDKGRLVLAGIDVAEGVAPAAADAPPPSVWPHQQMRANPHNRKVDPDTIPEMADSIAEKGILQPLVLSPPDERGIRTIWIGERRWRGYMMALDAGRLPADLAEGLPFVELAASTAEALAITLVENGERQDIPPLEEAFMLRDLADQLGLNAKDLAKSIGREKRVRDVQDKIRIARGASPEALAAYAEDGSWDRLRDSIPPTRTKAEEQAPLSPHFNPHRPAMTASDFGVPADFRAHGRDVSADEGKRRAAEWLDPLTRESYAMENGGHGFPRAQVQFARIRGSDGWVSQGGYSFAGIGHHASLDGVFSGESEAFPDRESAIAGAAALIRRSGAQAKGGVPRDVESWLQSIGAPDAAVDPLVVNGIRHPNLARANEARRAAGLLPRQSNSGGGRPALAPGLPLGDPDEKPLSPKAQLALIEIAHKTAEQPRPLDPEVKSEWTGDPTRDFAAFGAAAGKFWLDGAFNEIRQRRLAREIMRTGGQPPLVALTVDALAWFGAKGILIPVTEETLKAAQQEVHQGDWPDWLGRYVSEWLETEAQSATEAPLYEPDPARNDDPWDRTADQIAADVDQLAKVQAWIDARDPLHDAAQLFADLGVVSASVMTEGWIELRDGLGKATTTITLDPHNELPDERVRALELLIALAVNRTLGNEQ